MASSNIPLPAHSLEAQLELHLQAASTNLTATEQLDLEESKTEPAR